MKQNKIIATVLLVLLILQIMCSCGNENVTTDSSNTYNFETDMQYYYRDFSSVLPTTVTPDGYYSVGFKGIVIYIDKKTMKGTPLCNKPNCKHDDPDTCNAYIVDYSNVGLSVGDSSTETIIQYYKGKLYVMGSEYDSTADKAEDVLLSYNLDGTGKTTVTSPIISEDRCRSNWFIHRDYLYYISYSGIYRVPMTSPKEKAEKIFEVSDYQEGMANISSCAAYGDYIYFETYGQSDILQYFMIDTKTLETKELFINGKKARITGFLNGMAISYTMGNNEWEFYTSDLSFKENKLLSVEEVSYLMQSDGKYIYGDNIYLDDCLNGKAEQEIKIFDLKMKEIDSFVFPSDVPYDCLYAQDESCFFVVLPDDNEDYYIYYIDKNKIGTWNGSKAELNKVVKLKWASANLSDDIIMID